MKAFNDISDDVVELAHQRYSKVYNVFTHIKTLIQLAGWIASWFVLYPSCAAAGCNPLIFGAGMAILSQGIKFLEIDRESTNYEIFAARVRVAKELGFIDKNKTWGDVRKKITKEKKGRGASHTDLFLSGACLVI